MARILGVGIATLDWVFEVDHYPQENEEMRAQALRVARGGNASNCWGMWAQLGHQCDWAGVIAAAPESQIIRDDLAHFGVSTAHCVTRPGRPPTSSILLSPSGARTIVHYRDLPEFGYADFKRIDLAPFDWLHFEGRNIPELEKMLLHARANRPDLKISLEAEKPRDKLETVLSLPSVLLLSRALAQQRGFDDPIAFLHAMRSDAPNSDLFLGWSEQGAFALDRNGTIYHSPAFPPTHVIDTVGAGDTLNAGIIDGLVRGLPLAETLAHACRLAGRKCGVVGFEI
jgi:ketohexokinase